MPESSSKPPETKWLSADEAAQFVFKLTGVRITRQTVYNWNRKGLGRNRPERIKLKNWLRLGRWYTTEAWITEFIHLTGATNDNR